METVDSRMRRILFGFFAGVGAVIAWTALSLFLGSTHAQAAERPAGLLDDLTSNLTGTVTETVGAVTDLVDEIVAPVVQDSSETVAQTVDPVLDVVASLPVVGPPAVSLVEETVSTAVGTVENLVAPVVETLGDQPVARVVDPLLDSLERLPIVGSALENLRPVVTPAVGGVDEILGSVGGTIDGAVDAVSPGGTGAPGQPSEPARPGDDPAGAPPGDGLDAATAAQSSAGRASGPVNGNPAVHSSGAGFPASAAQGTSVPTLGSNSPALPGASSGAPPGSSSTAPTSSANSGGGSSGSVASIADADPLSLRAWERATGSRDDAIPASPVFDTDVSPD